MQIPYSWLATFLPALKTAPVNQLADFLTMSGLEVEEVIACQPQFSGVVVALVEAVERHPDAERLNVCRVNNGHEVLQIVCGAKNVRAGLKVPLAQVGGVLSATEPAIQIKAAKLRGVMSNGMLCSARELGLGEAHEGLMELPDDAPVGTDFAEYLAIADHLLTIKLTPNRGDCLSVLGVAREAVRFTPAQQVQMPSAKPIASTCEDRVKVNIEATDLCGRFTGRVVRGVHPQAPTPLWMVRRLEACGMRSVSALVDISNYVMLELGHPSHIFDRDKISGGLVVRWAKPDEALVLLDGKEVRLDAYYGVIADAQQIESLAGIMGGKHSAVSDDTRNVYIEIGAWTPTLIQGRARALGLQTDAGYRFERGVDHADHLLVMDRICDLIQAICATPDVSFGPIDDQQVAIPSPTRIRLRLSRLHKVLGVAMSQGEVAQCFESLGLSYQIKEVSGASADICFEVLAPTFRFDLKIEEDLIEECARVYGFDRIPVALPLVATAPVIVDESRKGIGQIRETMIHSGYQEVMNFGFVAPEWESEILGNPQAIKLKNPIAAHLAVMRSSLVPSLLENLRYNLDRRISRIRIFEMARTFAALAGAPSGPLAVKGLIETHKLAGLAYGDAAPLQWGEKALSVDFYDVKRDLEILLGSHHVEWRATQLPYLHPGQSAAIYRGGECLGYLGTLHPKLLLKYKLDKVPVVFELALEVLQQGILPAYQPIAKFPSVWRDVAFLVDEIMPSERFVKVFTEVQSGLTDNALRHIVLFDCFKGEHVPAGQKSLAFRLELQSQQGTLQDEVIEQQVAHFVARCAEVIGAQLR